MRFAAAVVVATLLLGTFALRAGAESVPAAPMDSRRSTHTATLLPSGKVLVTGGWDGFIVTSSSELYDWAANTWSSGPALTIARDLHTATLLGDGKLLVVGGLNNNGDALASAEIYDVATDRWSSAASIPNELFQHSATSLPNGGVIVVGGARDNRRVTPDVQLYDPRSDTWSSATSLPAARGSHIATLLPNGNVLVAGGWDNATTLGSAEFYDPASDTWTRTADMTRPRARHAATLLPSGKVLVLGGTDNFLGGNFAGNVLLSAELYDPVTETWTEAPILATGRVVPTATLLPNGVVLVAGGRIQDGNTIVSTTELYTESPPAVAVEVVEYFHAALDHYFITWLPSEIAALDAGTTLRGWQRTGYTFKTHTTPQALAGPVCRYYLPPQYGDSHFFGRGTSECEATGQNNPGFVLEDPTFMRMFLPVAGSCPIGTTPIYRAFSNRSDANHRYMIARTVRDQMVAHGWLAEGDGPDLVVMCAPL